MLQDLQNKIKSGRRQFTVPTFTPLCYKNKSRKEKKTTKKQKEAPGAGLARCGASVLRVARTPPLASPSICALHGTNTKRSRRLSPECSHRCRGSSQETEAPPRCWSRSPRALCTARSAESREEREHYWESILVSAKNTREEFLRPLRTLPFSGRTMDWEWQRCCLTSCRVRWGWRSPLPSAMVLRVSEEAARCMLFTGCHKFHFHSGGRAETHTRGM